MRALLVLVLAAMLVACGAMPSPERGTQGVAAAAAAWVDAYNSRDPARITGQYEPDAILWGTSSKTIANTPEQVRDYFKGAPNRPDARVAITEQHIRVAGDMAVSTGSYTFSDGTRGARPARYTLVFRQHGGQWRLLHHHSSTLPN